MPSLAFKMFELIQRRQLIFRRFNTEMSWVVRMKSSCSPGSTFIKLKGSSTVEDIGPRFSIFAALYIRHSLQVEERS